MEKVHCVGERLEICLDMEANMDQTLYAFWPHDQFPYTLGGTVVKMNLEGKVETVEFGKGYWFTPCKILPLEQGKMLQAKLDQLKNEYQTAVIAMNKTYFEKAAIIVDWI